MTSSSASLDSTMPYTGSDHVTVANGNILNISRIGNTSIARDIDLLDVLVVFKITKNLLSISKLTASSPVDILFSCDMFTIQNRHTKDILAKGRCENGLYVLTQGHKALVAETGLAMLFNANAPASLWVKAFTSAVYIINRLPIKLLDNKSSFEQLFNRAPNYDFFKLLVVRYSPQYKWNRCLDPITKCIYTTHHAKFDESCFPFSGAVSSVNLDKLVFSHFKDFGLSLLGQSKSSDLKHSTSSSSPSPCHLCPDDNLPMPPPTTVTPPALQSLPPPAASHMPSHAQPPTNTHPMTTRAKPKGYKSAAKNSKWITAMKEEMAALKHNDIRADTSLFVFQRENFLLYLLIYVDDIILTGNKNVAYNDKGLFLTQAKYAHDILSRAGFLHSKLVSTLLSAYANLTTNGDPFSDPTLYCSLVGALQYLTITKPELSYAVNQVSKFLHAPTNDYFQAVKRILRYVKGNLSFGLAFNRSPCVNLVSWSAKKQPTVSHSSCESEYRDLANTAFKVVWLTSLLRELQVPLPSIPVLYCDNKSAIFLSQNPVAYK
ncbi:uncharacterized mitochondrial protein-like protein [Tanacetum coccineum]